jgi:hypothetical protein
VTPCECCGQVVAKQLWVVEVEGEERRFCGPDCEQLYREHVLPKRRARTSSAAASHAVGGAGGRDAVIESGSCSARCSSDG